MEIILAKFKEATILENGVWYWRHGDPVSPSQLRLLKLSVSLSQVIVHDDFIAKKIKKLAHGKEIYL
jgi:hypothetical protein